MSAPRAVDCEARGDYRLWLRFEDGLEGWCFLGNLVEIGAFRAWRDVREFLRAAIDRETGVVVWPAGVRLDPEILWHDIANNERFMPKVAPRVDTVAFQRFMARVLGPQRPRRGKRG